MKKIESKEELTQLIIKNSDLAWEEISKQRSKRLLELDKEKDMDTDTKLMIFSLRESQLITEATIYHVLKDLLDLDKD